MGAGFPFGTPAPTERDPALPRRSRPRIDVVSVGLFLVPDTVMRSLALGAIVVALVSIVVALTFHPALLMVLGDRIDRLRLPWLGKRVAASAGPGEVLVSRTVKDLVAGTGLVLEDRGERELKGVPGNWRVYRASPEPVVDPH